jgi:sulfopyruvate decarboxylase subunit beta
MNPNILCEISSLKPSNLTLMVLDNGTYSTTGNQKTPAYDFVDLELLARSFGFASTRKAFTGEEIAGALQDFEEGPHLLHVVLNLGSRNAARHLCSHKKSKDS